MSLRQIGGAPVVTTRKPHLCWGCARDFPAGTRMERVTSVDDTFYTTYWCPTCQAFITQHDPFGMGDEIGCGDFWEWDDYAELVATLEAGPDAP